MKHQKRLAKLNIPILLDDAFENETKKIELSKKSQLILKDAYLHPYEKFEKAENARNLIHNLINKSLQSKMYETHHTPGGGFSLSLSKLESTNIFSRTKSRLLLRKQTSKDDHDTESII